jgi:hypothetical protein
MFLSWTEIVYFSLAPQVDCDTSTWASNPGRKSDVYKRGKAGVGFTSLITVLVAGKNVRKEANEYCMSCFC